MVALPSQFHARGCTEHRPVLQIINEIPDAIRHFVAGYKAERLFEENGYIDPIDKHSDWLHPSHICCS